MEKEPGEGEGGEAQGEAREEAADTPENKVCCQVLE